MDNPITIHRRARNLSRRGVVELAKSLGYTISESAIRQIEEGTAKNISKSVHAVFENFNGIQYPHYGTFTVNKEYNEYIYWKRTRIVELGIPFILHIPAVDYLKRGDSHPMVQLLTYMNVKPTAFCQAMCVPKSSFFRYITTQQRDMPSSLVKAFRDCGISMTTINELDTAGRAVYDKKRDGAR